MTNMVGCERIRTSAYHPASNSILERKTLKSAIMCHANANWIDVLPTVMLGLRTCFKEDIQASPADMLYGSSLRILGEFFIEEDPPSDPEIFLEKHRLHMREIKSSLTSHHQRKTTFFHKSLFDCSHVWLRADAVRKSLQPPYSGPFRDVERINDNLFSIDISGKTVNVSTECLKPAFLPKDFVEVRSPSTFVASVTPVLPPAIMRPLRTYLDPKKVNFAT
ncbi:hypothetical protein X777_06949 [Ooceraea biroi]|uniref:Integrase catalytic domain-containing protein n=1 Tax=Ooceraea biroi TaxID=2015173 RepID=A0A026WCA8_OOCBI|nr:hypothetical protein X777_06949 [Ooceraea biroi]